VLFLLEIARGKAGGRKSQALFLVPSCHAATSSLNHAILRGAI
jgi:hypothetical protein